MKPFLKVLSEALCVHFRFNRADCLAIVSNRLVRVLEFLFQIEFLRNKKMWNEA